MKKEPFATTPDPNFLFLSDKHQKALDRLMAAVTKRRGITALVGEPGLGKSTLLRAMLSRLEKTITFAWVFNTTMDATELLKFVCRDFGFTPKGASKSDILLELYSFFVREYEENRIPLIIIDEAQNLQPDALEEIRQLSNFETVNRKMVQIILCGQPQLETTLELPELAQLKQRISYKATLARLSETETVAYINHRLSVAGCSDGRLFSQDAQAQIYQVSGGIPRLINQVCDEALHTAMHRNMPQIDGGLVRELVNNGDVMQAPPLPVMETRPVIKLEKMETPQPTTQKAKPAAAPRRSRVIQSKSDLFEAIDLAELLSVI